MIGSSTPPRARYGSMLPVDVERGRMRRGRAPFQHVEPPRIVGEMHADMVGDEIEDQAEIVLLQRRAQPLEAGLAAELRIELGVIDDVVAVGAALARLHEGRGIEMA